MSRATNKNLNFKCESCCHEHTVQSEFVQPSSNRVATKLKIVNRIATKLKIVNRAAAPCRSLSRIARTSFRGTLPPRSRPS